MRVLDAETILASRFLFQTNSNLMRGDKFKWNFLSSRLNIIFQIDTLKRNGTMFILKTLRDVRKKVCILQALF